MSLPETLNKTFFRHVLGPRGGLFAMGCVVGAFSMHLYVMEFVVSDLKKRVGTLESSNEKMMKHIQEIAFSRLEGQ